MLTALFDDIRLNVFTAARITPMTNNRHTTTIITMTVVDNIHPSVSSEFPPQSFSPLHFREEWMQWPLSHSNS